MLDVGPPAMTQALWPILITAALAACASPDSNQLLSACDIASKPEAYDGAQVRLRGRIEFGPDFSRAYDPNCESFSIYLSSEKVNLSGCTLPDADQERFGCPLDGSRGVRATFAGTFSKPSKSYGHLVVDSMSDIRIEP